MKQEISAFEHNGWKALSTDRLIARAYYEKLLDDAVVMMLPGGIEMRSAKAVLDSFSERPWDWFKIDDENVINLDTGIRLMTYRVSAQRQGEEIYRALVSSIYHRKNDDWKLVFHQQTPA